MPFRQGRERVKVRCRPNIRGQGIIGTCTIDPKTALVFGGFSQRQSQLITFGEVRVDLVSVPKFTQQIRRCYSIDAFINKDSFKEVTACLQMRPAEYIYCHLSVSRLNERSSFIQILICCH